MSSGTDEMEAELDAEAMQEATGGKQDFFYALRKFRKDCENFAMHSFSLSYHSGSYCA